MEEAGGQGKGVSPESSTESGLEGRAVRRPGGKAARLARAPRPSQLQAPPVPTAATRRLEERLRSAPNDPFVVRNVSLAGFYLEGVTFL